MSSSVKLNQVLFILAVLDLGFILGCLRFHVPVSYAVYIVIALVQILFLLMMNSNVSPVPVAVGDCIVPDKDDRDEVGKMIERYGLDGEHPSFTRSDWMRAIATDQTQDSYWEWVTKNEALANNLITVPGLNVFSTDRHSSNQAGRSRVLELLRPRALNE